MRRFLVSSMILAGGALLLGACGGDSSGSGGGGGAGGSCPAPTGGANGSKIGHVILIVQENHTFDDYFGHYCKAAAGSNPTCNDGPSCCEAVPAKEPSGASPIALDDTANGAFDPDHSAFCEVAEMNGGKMDKYVTGVDKCSDPRNFAVATDAALSTYLGYASKYAMADRYFQPLAGQSSSNDMYFAVAKWVFDNNDVKPDSTGKDCDTAPKTAKYEGQTTLADVMKGAGKKLRAYAEGFDRMKNEAPGSCPNQPKDCPAKLPTYPCNYTLSDIPYLYYAQHADDADFVHDYSEIKKDITGGTLPEVSFVKALGYHTEHPDYGTTLSAGEAFVDDLVQAVEKSCYAADTLILLSWDEGGGFYDHVAPPPDSTVDMKPYGTRVPFVAIGKFAKKNFVSHVEMEHSSVVKFIEYNFTGQTGQLKARDAVVNNLGSLLDPAATGITIPEK